MSGKNGRRRLIISRVQYGMPVGGVCSVCRQGFDVDLGDAEALSEAKERLMAVFERHQCTEPAKQSLVGASA
jgi:hypothetical protein